MRAKLALPNLSLHCYESSNRNSSSFQDKESESTTCPDKGQNQNVQLSNSGMHCGKGKESELSAFAITHKKNVTPVSLRDEKSTRCTQAS
jgi:hypothetical protein